MQGKRTRSTDKASESAESPELTWEGADLPRVSPGSYRAVCIGWQGPAWVRSFRRWSLRLEFSLLGDGTLVSGFYNLGNDPEKPRLGRQSRIYAVWSQANGEAPRKGQQMTLETLSEEGLLYTVRVADATKDGNKADKPDALVYSRVTEVFKIERP
jgi:hypothetical protein